MKPVLIVVAVFSLGGCATIVRGSTEKVQFVSEPPGAQVSLSNGLSCLATPCVIELSRRDEPLATFTKPGHQPVTVPITTVVSGGGVAVGAGNLIAGGVVGIGVDAYNGANLDHTPNPVNAILPPVPPAPTREGKPRQNLS